MQTRRTLLYWHILCVFTHPTFCPEDPIGGVTHPLGSLDSHFQARFHWFIKLLCRGLLLEAAQFQGTRTRSPPSGF